MTANQVIGKQEAGGVVLPNNIVPGKFVHFTTDNNDLNEETLDGKNIAYATTLVVYQDIANGKFGHRFFTTIW